MTEPTTTNPERRARLEAAMAEYLIAADAGKAPEPEGWLARHPDLRAELAEFLADHAGLDGSSELRPAVAARLRSGTDSGGFGFRGVRCRQTGPRGHRRSRHDFHGRGQRPAPHDARRDASALLRRLRAAPGAGPRRHGRRLQGPAAQPQPPGRPEDDPRRPSSPRDDERPPVPERGRGRRPASTTRTSCRSTRSASTTASHYFSMKLIEGGSLDRAARRLRAPTPEAAARLVADGRRGRCTTPTSAASSTATSSRPTSCSTTEGQPHVTDFGLAKRVEGDSELTAVRRDRRHAELHGPRAGRRPRRGGDDGRPTSTAWARSSTSCSPAGRRSAATTVLETLRAGARARAGSRRARSTRGSTATWRRSA